MEKLMESEVELDVDIFYYTDDNFEYGQHKWWIRKLQL